MKSSLILGTLALTLNLAALPAAGADDAAASNTPAPGSYAETGAGWGSSVDKYLGTSGGQGVGQYLGGLLDGMLSSKSAPPTPQQDAAGQARAPSSDDAAAKGAFNAGTQIAPSPDQGGALAGSNMITSPGGSENDSSKGNPPPGVTGVQVSMTPEQRQYVSDQFAVARQNGAAAASGKPGDAVSIAQAAETLAGALSGQDSNTGRKTLAAAQLDNVHGLLRRGGDLVDRYGGNDIANGGDTPATAAGVFDGNSYAQTGKLPPSLDTGVSDAAGPFGTRTVRICHKGAAC